MAFRDNFRDTTEWLDSTNGCIKLNTASNEAAKQYDATVTQYCGWYEDDSIGGLDGTTNLMIESDPEFVLGQALNLELVLSGALTSPSFDQTLKEAVDSLNKLVETKKDSLTDHELLHVQVVNHWAKCELKDSIKVLEKIITLYPEDITAIKMNQDTTFMLGTASQTRYSLASTLAKMSKKNPLKGYAHGMFAFALEESNMYELAKAQAREALSLIPFDTWAIHNYAHCLEMEGEPEKGLSWLKDRQCDWLPCQTLACHQYWHTALFHINNNQFDEAIGLLDNEILTRCVSRSSSLDLHDAASMVYRMELVDLFNSKSSKSTSGDEKYKRWEEVYKMFKPHKNDHLWAFNDAHFLMSYLGMEDMKTARELIDTIDESPALVLSQSVIRPLLEAMYQFKLANYSDCVDLLEGIRFEIINIGGSHAQRDLFEQLLLVAALKSDKVAHNQLGNRMLLEREALHGRILPQTDLLKSQTKV